MIEFVAAMAFLGSVVAVALGWALYRLRKQMIEQETRVAALTRRVYELETSGGQSQAVHPPLPPPLPSTELIPMADPSEPIEPTIRAEDTEGWEEVIGGNWLNRVGALVLVIGIALFLGYSLTQLGAAGKVAIGFAAGVSMLAAGIALGRNDRYANFSLSLVGSGWAATYFTAYAAHAIEPARIIDNPLLAGVLLFAVSAGMIVHALAYASEPGTALAFLFSFISLNVTPPTGFSLYAAVLLALSMLVLAWMRSWFKLAVAGILLCYGTFVLRRDAGETLDLWALWIQWSAFEAFGVLHFLRGDRPLGAAGRSLFLLNAVGFVGVSLLHYGWQAGRDLGWFLFAASVAYLFSTVVRAKFVRSDARAIDRLIGGGYEGALAASAALMAGGLSERFGGTNLTFALLVEGEMIWIAGHVLNNSLIRRVGAAVLALSFGRAALLDPMAAEKRTWTPTSSLVAAVLAANRFRGGWAYAAGAGVLAALVIVAEVSREWAPAFLAIAGTAAFALASHWKWQDIRAMHLPWAAGTFLAGWIALDYGDAALLPAAVTIACFYVCEFVSTRAWYARPVYSIFGTLLLALLLLEQVQGRLLTVALGVQGAALLVAGLIASERVLRLSGLVLFLGCIGKAFVYDLRQLDTFSRILSFIGLGLLLLGASWVYTRFRDRIRRLL